MGSTLIVLAGATGNLGGRIAGALIDRGARVRAIVRRGTTPVTLEPLRKRGVETVEVDFDSIADLTTACTGAACVVSVLSGLREVIIDAQTRLLDAAVAAGVQRFIPSDFAIDFTKLPRGSNRNLDLRQEFHERLDKAPIRATSILNGMFADLLTGQAPFVLFKIRRVLYWENADQPMDFTTVDDTARFTAAAAVDATTPRYLRIAGDTLTARELMEIAAAVTGSRFRLLRGGGLKRLDRLIRIVRRLFPARDEVYPPWQGMQYMRDMYSGRAKLQPLDNDLYPEMKWTRVRDVLATRGGRSATRD